MATSSTAISSLPRSKATPDKLSLQEEAVVEQFGFGIFAFGGFIVKALGRHLDRVTRARELAGQPASVEPAPAEPPVADLAAAVDALEAAAPQFWLRPLIAAAPGAAADGAQGGSSTRAHLKSMLERCGGLERLDAAIYDLLMYVQTKVDGGILHNPFRIGFWSDGSLGIHCATCNKERTLAFGNSGHACSTRPFNNFTIGLTRIAVAVIGSHHSHL